MQSRAFEEGLEGLYIYSVMGGEEIPPFRTEYAGCRYV
jgi:hypothetical protein